MPPNALQEKCNVLGREYTSLTLIWLVGEPDESRLYGVHKGRLVLFMQMAHPLQRGGL